MNIKQLQQDKADNDAAQARLKAEGNKLLSIKAGDRTPEQATRLEAVTAELTTAINAATTITADLARASMFQEEEREAGRVAAAVISTGVDLTVAKPWGPVPAANASADEIARCRQVALGIFAIAVKDVMSGQPADARLFASAIGMGGAVPSDGGFAIPIEVAPGIERLMFEVGQILGRVDARTVQGNGMTFNVLDETSRADSSRQGGVLGYWVDEGTAPTASQFKLARMELKLRKVGVLGYMTDELVADASALGGELERMFVDELVFQVENAIYRGEGGVKPLGFMATACPCLVTVNKVSGQASTTLVTRNFSDMWARLPARSQANAVWLVNVDTQPMIDELVNPAGTAGIAPRFVNYGPTGALTIKGRPVIAVEYAETLGTAGDVSLVDLSQYRLIRKGGPQSDSSIHVRFTTGEQTFRAFYRCDGQPVPRKAITPFKGSGTLSPFINLQSR